MVDYAQLSKLDTTKLTSASAASGTFATAISGRGESVRTKSDIPAGMWQGGDATAAGDLLAGMSDPLFDVSDSANRGKKTLDDLVTALGKAKEHLQGAHDAIRGTDITIDAKGVVKTPVVNDPGLAAENDRKAQDAADIITEALKMANDADKTATEGLNSLAESTSASYMEIPGKKEQLDQAVDLLNTPKNKITPQIAKQLNDLLAQNNNPEFNKQLMERLGPEALIENSARFSETGAKAAENGDTAAADEFKRTQQLLGESLASASQNNGLSPEWTQRLMDKGAQPLVEDPAHNGYRALAPLLEHGKYDKDFLVPVAEHMTRLDASVGGGNINPYNPGAGASQDNPYVIDAPGSPPSNPLNSVMTALDNNPDAATDYFTGSNDEFGMKYNDASGNALAPIEGPTANPNIDYALERTADGSGTSLDVDQVGNALEAAATGVSSDAAPDAPRPDRSVAMSDIAEHLVHRFGHEAGNDDIMPGGDFENMADNMTDIASTYMPEIHNSFLGPTNADAYLQMDGVETLAGFNENDAAGLLHALGRHDDSFDQLLGASNEVQERMVAQEYLENPADADAIQKALTPGDTATNILSDAQVEGGVQEAVEADKSQNDRTDLAASGAKIVSAAIPNGPLSAGVGEIIDKLKDGAQVDTTQQALYDENVQRTDLKDVQADRKMAILESIVRQDGVTPAEAALLDEAGGVSNSVDVAIENAWSNSKNEVPGYMTDGNPALPPPGD